MNKLAIILLVFTVQLKLLADEYKVNSPDNSIEVNIKTDAGVLFYSVIKNEEVVIKSSRIGLETNAFDLSVFGDVLYATESTGKDDYDLYWGITDKLEEEYNQLLLTFSDEVRVEFRAYNCGFAWRYKTSLDEDLIVKNEIADYNISTESTVFFPEVDGFSTPFEANYLPHKIGDIENTIFGITPLMVKSALGTSLVFTDVNLKNYPGTFMELSNKGLKSIFPDYPKKEKEQLPGRLRLTNIPQISKKMVKSTEDYIAKSADSNDFPWRAVLIESKEVDMLTNNLVAALADKPEESKDFSWVKPGKVVWDWYHKWNLEGVDFKPGVNTATYKYMIDFATENNLQYINIDDGWCGLHNFSKVNKHLDLLDVIAYAKSKGIGVFLWCTWQTLQNDLEYNLDHFKQLGISGLKVDFFDRTDQVVVDFINTLADECAQRELLLNLHGMYKPTGIQVTWPNLVNFEGILGLEYNKFSDKCTPTHNATAPFIRNAVGPMDYTPGGMRYVDSADFKDSWSEPHVMTTRAQQMAMYVVYHGGVQMLADSPTLFEKDAIALNYLSQVPVTWDETIPLDGKIGQYVVVARRSGNDWYVAGLNSGKERNYSVNLDFLPGGSYAIEMISDGISAEELNYSKYVLKENNRSVNIKAKAAGGFVLHISK